MIRLTTLIWLALASLAGVGLFQVKYRVQSLEQDLGQINRQILRDQEAIHVLGAEWSLLNEPARLADMSRRHLELAPFTAAQLARFSDLPGRVARDPATPDDLVEFAPVTVGPATIGPAATPAPPVPVASAPEADPDVAAVLASMRGNQ
jgi:cell division protein FtsL